MNKIMNVGELADYLAQYDRSTPVFASVLCIDGHMRQFQDILQVGGGQPGLAVCLLTGFE